MRDHPNSRMISHFNKMITVTNERVDVAKQRYDDLKQEVYKMKEEERKRVEKNKKKKRSDPLQEEAISLASSKEVAEVYSSSDESYDDDSSDTIENDCSIELNYDGNGSSITRLSKGVSTTPTEETNDNDLSISESI